MKPIVLASFLAATTFAHADLVITEVMASSQHPAAVSPNPDADGDWWELTNTGASAVSLNNYQWDDTPTPATPSVSFFPPGITLQPGESIIILQEPAANVPTWKDAWGLGSEIQVINRDQFSNMGGEGFSNLSALGDEVNLYDGGGNLVARAAFGASVSGKSQAFNRDGTPILGVHSEAGKHGARSSTLSPSDVGSPGDTGVHFTSAPVLYALGSYHYPVTSLNPGGTTPVLSASGLPAFLTLTPGADGTGTLASNRALTLADAGLHTIQITATSGVVSTVQEFVLTVLNPHAPILLNEYNAVAAANFLNGGTALADDDGGAASQDAYFGRVMGNGGQWVEFVVVGDGGTDPVDMRGWTIEIGTNAGTGFYTRNKLVLSNHGNWQAVPTGTILTFTDKTTAQGGCNSGFELRNRRSTTGDTWTNIWMGDSTYLSYTSLATNGYSVSAGAVSGILIDNNTTQFRVKNASGAIVFGPAGEGVAPYDGVNSKEVFELEGHPTPSVSPLVASSASGFGYSDGASESTFGYPNNWLDGATVMTQRFTVLSAPEIEVQGAGSAAIADGDTQDFGNVNVGDNLSVTFNILNTGTADLTGILATIDGANAGDFEVTSEPDASLSPSGSTTVTVRFSPAALGARNAVLHIASNDDDEASYDIALIGTGFVLSPEIAVQQPGGGNLIDGVSTRSFGTVALGANTSVTFTILNSGTGALTGLSATLDGSNAADFSVVTAATAPVAQGGSTTLTVRFKPIGNGVRKATLHIANNDPDEAPFDIYLTGTGFTPAPEIGVQQPKGSELADGKTKKSFGTVKLGKSGKAKKFTIRNTGKANLTSLAVTRGGKHAKDFVITQPLKKTLAPGASTTFTVTFKPKAKGTRSGTLKIKSNDANENPFDIQITGFGLN